MFMKGVEVFFIISTYLPTYIPRQEERMKEKILGG